MVFGALFVFYFPVFKVGLFYMSSSSYSFIKYWRTIRALSQLYAFEIFARILQMFLITASFQVITLPLVNGLSEDGRMRKILRRLSTD